MAARELRFRILAEDTAHLTFVLRWLQSEGVQTRHIDPLPVAAGAGAGEQRVRLEYAREVARQRRKAHHQRVALIVVTDADSGTVGERLASLEETLEEPRRMEERIAVLIPRRNVETWLRALAGHATDENTDWSQQLRGELAEACHQAGTAFASFLRRPPAAGDLPSLTASRAEVRRL